MFAHRPDRTPYLFVDAHAEVVPFKKRRIYPNLPVGYGVAMTPLSWQDI
jgi:hypothetical protein